MPSSKDAIAAIILSAGFSTRMGQFKPLMPLGEKTLLHRTIDLFETSGVDDILVVTGHRAGEVERAVSQTAACCIENDVHEKGMFSSVSKGVAALSTTCRAFFLLPVDIPLVRPATVRRLTKAFEQRNDKRILLPVFDGRPGHPPMIDARLCPYILSWHGRGGLRAFFAEHAEVVLEVPVADEAILQDLDNPDDIAQVTRRLSRRDLPTHDECLAWLVQVQRLPTGIVRHCRTVAGLAVSLAQGVRGRCSDLDIDLIFTAALLHDIGRLEKSHARVGAKLLETEGFPKVANIVRQHMDIEVDPAKPLCEAEVVYLADKMVMENTSVMPSERFAASYKKYKDSNLGTGAWEKRQRNAGLIQAKVEQAAGCSLQRFLGESGTV
jgi:putative nucleotidyltransferase with HDIG domain